MPLYCATTNPGKLREFRLASQGSMQFETLPGLSEIPVCEETGATFEENAAQKAQYYSAHGGVTLFAEDSGLEVDALAGAPGVYSARYAGPNATDEENNRLVLARMEGHANRRARFVCVTALARSGELICIFRGEVEGQLLDEPRGAGGFGYDPLFFYPPLGCSFGELNVERKLEVSHRGKALKAMLSYLEERRCFHMK